MEKKPCICLLRYFIFSILRDKNINNGAYFYCCIRNIKLKIICNERYKTHKIRTFHKTKPKPFKTLSTEQFNIYLTSRFNVTSN